MSIPTFDRRTFVKIAAAAGAGFSARASAQSPDGFKLPDLPYSFDALEPHIDAKTMEIHHGKHHAAYINNLNAAIQANKELQGKDLDALLGDLPAIRDEALRTTVRNNGGGHWNHTFFWESLAPAGKGGEPHKDLADAIARDFGSLDDFKKAFADAAAKRFGSGWAWLIRQGDKLKVVSTPNQDAPFMHGIVPESDIGSPLLGLDVWEHAYYLHYQNRRPDYVTAWWNVVDWNAVSKRLAAS